mgnify:CR=1 FL=1|jgi:predicted ATP-dependent serine protease
MQIEILQLSSIVNNSDNYSEGESIFGDYIHQGDLALIVGDTNSGKTLIASDIAFANNNNLCYWDEPMTNRIRKTIIIDGEHSDSQIARRYEKLLECTSGDLVRGRFTDAEYNSSIEDRLLAIENLICSNDMELLIIDNLMCMLDNYKSAKQTQQFIQGLKQIKEQYDLTIILVAHLSKRNSKNPIEIKDISGSSVIANYADSIIAVGNSCEGDAIKYIKHLKSRSSIKMSDVAVMVIVEEPYLHFEFRQYDNEENHLLKKSVSRSSISPSIRETILRLKEEGYSVRNIADQLSLSKSAVGRFLKNNNPIRGLEQTI